MTAGTLLFTRCNNKDQEAAKSEATKAKRIAMTITAMLKKQDFGTMIRENQQKNST